MSSFYTITPAFVMALGTALFFHARAQRGKKELAEVGNIPVKKDEPDVKGAKYIPLFIATSTMYPMAKLSENGQGDLQYIGTAGAAFMALSVVGFMAAEAKKKLVRIGLPLVAAFTAATAAYIDLGPAQGYSACTYGDVWDNKPGCGR